MCKESIQIESIRNIVKGHLVMEHGNVLTSIISDQLSEWISESIVNYFAGLQKNILKMSLIDAKE